MSTYTKNDNITSDVTRKQNNNKLLSFVGHKWTYHKVFWNKKLNLEKSEGKMQ